MKKFLFVVAALATSLAASAQLWVAGGVNVGSSRSWGDDKSTTTWGISPSIGYALDDALEVGLNFGLNGSSYDDASRFGFDIAPFVRYTFLSEGDFSLFVEGEVGYTYSKIKDADNASWAFGAKIQPGIKYAFTDHFAMVAKMGGLYFDHNDPAVGGGLQNKFGLNFNTDLKFGLVYSF